MSPPGEGTLPAARRARKSIGAYTNARKSVDKENATLDLDRPVASSKKSRSKSLGPGGLHALKQGSGNRRSSLAAPQRLPRSILKPTVSLPEIPPLKKKGSPVELHNGGSENDDANGSRVALRTEEEQQAAARDREERERREARRKSLANRRVSFAAEATLHTFHEVEYNQDSTTSTDSTRRASSVAGKSPAHSSHEREFTPHEQIENGAPEPLGKQQEFGQQKRRRSSALPPMNFHGRDDNTASTIYSSDSEPPDAVEEYAAEEDEGSSSDSDDGTMMSVVTEEVTGTSVGSDRSVDSDAESSTLDEALRLAAQRAGTQSLGQDESEAEDDDEGEEVIPSFGWIKKGNPQNDNPQPPAPAPGRVEELPGQNDDGTEMDMNMDMTSAVGGILKPSAEQTSSKDEGDEDMSMEVTRVFGGILGQRNAEQGAPQPTEEGDAPEEATMEFTTAIGGIRPTESEDYAVLDNGNEDMSMELTAVMGGVHGQQKRESVGPKRRRTTNQSADGDGAAMDMTTGVGRILSGGDGGNDGEEDTTMGMDITTAIGGVISNNNSSDEVTNTRNLGKRIMVEEGDKPHSPKKAIAAAVSKGSPKKRPSPLKSTTPAAASENEDPGLWAFRGKGLRRSVGPPAPTSPKTAPDSGTPSPARLATPGSRSASSASPRKNVPSSQPQRVTRSASRSASPEKPSANSKTATPSPFKGTRRSPEKPSSARSKTTTPSPSKGTRKNSSPTQNGPESENRTPSAVLTPQSRKLSGVGVDRNGLGSPRVAALFERRSSIGNAATDFVPGKRGVTFQDPKDMVDEVDRERQSEEDKENRRAILERQADSSQEDKDATLNLREMIDNLSPKRNPLKGRKSLHVGSAKGLLGKRPAELDDEEEAEEQDGVKRLKGHQGSPVKNIRLKNPPSKFETTGRLTLTSRPSLDQPGRTSTPTLSSPVKAGQRETPKHQTRFMDVEDQPTTQEVNIEESPPKDPLQLGEEADGDRIHLQDFLNMTSIRFMELTTTKRRPTVAPDTFHNGVLVDGRDDMSLERCVVTGACTVPTLELYQHSCRELKKYISEGRRIVKEIESDTFEENPPLFREYMSATPDVKALMDNQFKNVKTHARLLSKAMWYEWRMKLQDGLKEGLVKISEGMNSDQKLMQKQQDLLASVVPEVVSRYEAMLETSNNLEEAAQELADSDPAELHAARDELSELSADIAQKKKLIAELRQQYEECEADTEALSAKKEACLGDIRESEKIREECRGWTSAEISSFKERVDAIEREHGWAVTGISDTTLSMAYRREIELVFDIASFQSKKPTSQIDLWYVAGSRESNDSPKTAEKEFFLQCVRDHIRALPPNETPVSELLRIVAVGWDKARLVASHINRVNLSFPTTVTKTSDASVAITSSLLLVPLETKVEITLHLHGRSGSAGIDVGINPQARVVYGEHFNVTKVREFLATRIGEAVGVGEEEWSDVVVELKERLLARGRKQ